MDECAAVGEDPKEPHYEEETRDGAEGDADDGAGCGTSELVAAGDVAGLADRVVVVAFY